MRKQIGKCLFKNSHVNTTCVPNNEQSRVFCLKNGTTKVQGPMCEMDDVSRQHRIVADITQSENARACIYDWVEVIFDLYGSGKAKHAINIVHLPIGKYFELNMIQESLKDLSVCLPFARETDE